MVCNHCKGTVFLNSHQLPIDISVDDTEKVVKWIKENFGHDVSVCDCCGDGEAWHGTPGNHYGNDDPSGKNGPYVYNGGLCECH
jgi:hypothetical protein